MANIIKGGSPEDVSKEDAGLMSEIGQAEWNGDSLPRVNKIIAKQCLL